MKYDGHISFYSRIFQIIYQHNKHSHYTWAPLVTKTYSQQSNISNYKLLYVDIVDIYIKYKMKYYNNTIINVDHIYIIMNQ